MKKIKNILAIILISFCFISKSQPYPQRSVECGNLKVNYGYKFHFTGSASNYTITDNDYFVNCASTITVTLPDCTGRAGQTYFITNSSPSGTLTIATTSAQTITGFTIANGLLTKQVLQLWTNGANWFTINLYIPQ